MTRLYRLDTDAAPIARLFDAHAGKDPWAGGYVVPGGFAPVVTAGREFIAGARMERGPHRIVPRMWGVPPPPAAGDPGRGVCTVRNPNSPFWAGNLRNSEFRCLVPATSFMVWGAGIYVEGRREQIWIGGSDQPLFAMAGVWKDSEVPSFAIVSCQANALLREHGRETMPVVLQPDRAAYDLWLHGGWDRAKDLLRPLSSDLLEERQG